TQVTHLRRGWSLAVVVVALSLVVAGTGYLLWSRLATQIGELVQTLPRSLDEIKATLMQYPWGRYLVDNATDAADGLAGTGAVSKVTGLVGGLAGFLEATIVILMIGIFGAAEPDLYRTGLLHLVPPG